MDNFHQFSSVDGVYWKNSAETSSQTFTTRINGQMMMMFLMMLMMFKMTSRMLTTIIDDDEDNSPIHVY